MLRNVFYGRQIESYFRPKVVFKLLAGLPEENEALETYQVKDLKKLCHMLLWLLKKLCSWSYVKSHVSWATDSLGPGEPRTIICSTVERGTTELHPFKEGILSSWTT